MLNIISMHTSQVFKWSKAKWCHLSETKWLRERGKNNLNCDFLEILLLLQCVVIDDEQDFPISFGVAGIPKVMQKPEHALRKNSHQWQPKGPQLSTKKKNK